MRKLIKSSIAAVIILFNITSANAQGFSFTLQSDSISTNVPGTELIVAGMLTNLSTVDDVMIYIVRKENNLPTDWLSSLCTDVCLPPSGDSTYLYLYAGDSSSFTFHFYTTATEDSGNAVVTFRNAANASEVYSQRFYGKTDSSYTAGLQHLNINKNQDISLFPNPCSNYLSSTDNISGKEKYVIVDALGKQTAVEAVNNMLDISLFPNGNYTLLIYDRETIINKPFVISR